MPVVDHLSPRQAGPAPQSLQHDAPRGAAHLADNDAERRYHFDIYRVERVSMTSIFFSGDDWRWTFRAPSGVPLAESGSYRNEAACRTAVAALQEGAGSATLRQGQQL